MHCDAWNCASVLRLAGTALEGLAQARHGRCACGTGGGRLGALPAVPEMDLDEALARQLQVPTRNGAFCTAG